MGTQSALANTSHGYALQRLPLLTLYLTERCQSRCAGCDYGRVAGGADVQPAQVAQWLPALERLGTRIVVLSGGEPLLNPHLLPILRLLRDAGLRLWLLTSGLPLAHHARALPGLVDHVTVSLDGADAATYLATRGIDAFDATCRGIRASVQAGLDTRVRVTVQRANHLQLVALTRLARELGATQVSFLAADVSNATAFARNGATDAAQALTPDELPRFAGELMHLEHDCAAEFASGFIAESPARLRRLHQYFAALLGLGPFPPVRCNAPEFSAVLDARGALHPCFFIPGAIAPAARSPTSMPLDQSLNSDAMQSLRAQIAHGQRAECERCVCSKWCDPARAGELA